ncbi:MAG: flavin reductase family protein [Chloroflexota bacterium]
MPKIQLDPGMFLIPMPVILVGAQVHGKPNYVSVAHCGIMNHQPPIISVALTKSHYTNLGIEETGTFSVNVPSAQMIEVTDYCGLVSGRKVDKSGLFAAFYGKMENAPMIEECPLNLECRVLQTLNFAWDKVYIGEIVAAYAEEGVLADGAPDIRKVDPAVLSLHDGNYWRIGEHIGKAWEIGKDYKGAK